MKSATTKGRVIVAGSMNMDVVAYGPRLPQPGETVMGDRIAYFPGGKGLNPAVAAAKQGAAVELVARLGEDVFGEELRQFARENGVGLTHLVRDPETTSGTAVILVADAGKNQITVVPGANGRLSPEDVSLPELGPDDVLLSLFEIPLPTVEAFLRQGREAGARTILSPSPAAACGFLDLPDLLILNETELAFYLGLPAIDSEADQLAQFAQGLRARPDQTVVLTLGAEGALAVEGDRVVPIPGRPVNAVDTTAAGDCFTGTLAARLANGDTLESALNHANVAASISVTRPGAAVAMPTADEVAAALDAMA